MLRVLKLENIDRGYIGKLPKDIKNLLLLRFLSLRNSHVSKLSSSIGRLSTLQMLDLRTNWRLELPSAISNMVGLRHLYLPSISFMANGKILSLENLGNLQTLVCVWTEYFDLKKLRKLKSLVKCRLVVHDVVCLKQAVAGRKTVSFDHLESLALENSTSSGMKLEPFLLSCPRLRKLQLQGQIDESILPQGLTKVCLKLTRLEVDLMAKMGSLENLNILVLDYSAFNRAKMVCKYRSFPCLVSLSLIKLEQLTKWNVEVEALTKLSYLHINYCYNLKEFPQGLRNIDTLKEVTIQRMPMAWLEGGGKEGQGVSRKITIIDPLD